MKNFKKKSKVCVIALLILSLSACCIINPNHANCKPQPNIFPASLNFGLNQSVMSFTIKNDGKGEFDWQAVNDAPWINISALSGTVSTNKQLIEVTVDRAKMSSGINTSEIKINTSEGPYVVNVNAERQVQLHGLKLHFSSLYINDDKEIGEGDWRIRINVNGNQAVYISKKEAGTGESVTINKYYNTDPGWSRVEIFCKIHEQDAGEWEYVGEKSVVFQRSGENWPSGTVGSKTIVLSNDEGKVTLKYSVSEL